MSPYYLILILFFLNYSSTKSQNAAIQQLDLQIESEKFVAKLTKSKVDLIIVFSKICSGCIPSTPNPYYIFWVKKAKTKLTKFTEYSKHKPLSIKNISQYFTLSLLDSLTEEKLHPSSIWLSHYLIENIIIYSKNKHVSFEITTTEKGNENKDKKRVQILNQLNSIIENIEKNKWK